ncbi:MAG: hypothetical protein FJ095_02250 [Deltaproteobacteria bacterium]|nr:hypothetical protein [Deltaproteobacteria bacterium]
MTPRPLLLAAPLLHAAHLALAAGTTGCSRRAPEPESTRESSPRPPDAPTLAWSAPASWTLEKSAKKGLYRAKYVVPAQGDAPHPAEVLVTHLGKGEVGGLDAPLAELAADFEAPTDGPRRAERTSRGFVLRELEVAGTYRFPMGPKVGKRQVAQMMKPGWRALGVGVRAPTGELWFFRIVGPDDAVKASASPFRAMLEALEVRGDAASSGG